MEKINIKWFLVSYEIVDSKVFKIMRRSSRTAYFYISKLRNKYCNPVNEGWFFFSLHLLAKEIGISTKTLKGAIQQLIESGFIEEKPYFYSAAHKRVANWYRIKESKLKAELSGIDRGTYEVT